MSSIVNKSKIGIIIYSNITDSRVFLDQCRYPLLGKRETDSKNTAVGGKSTLRLCVWSFEIGETQLLLVRSSPWYAVVAE